MSYYVNTSQLASIKIGGEDVTDSVINWVVSDSSLFNRGIMSTVGTLTLARKDQVAPLADYGRDNYPRGTKVVARIRLADGTFTRHPRGLLYVISSSYNPESVELSLEIGCRLALASLTDNVSQIIDLVPIPLDPAQDDFSSVSGSFAAAGKYLYQNNQGELVVGDFFEGNRYGEMSESAWVSVFGTTTSSVQPLQSGGAIPDQISLSYEYPSGSLTGDETGRIDTTKNTSNYFLQYPGVVYIREGDGIPDNISTEEPNPGYQNPCGNSPAPPGGNEQPGSCSSGYSTVNSVITVPAKRKEYSENHYGAIGAQASYSYKETRGPAIELNGQYFADAYAACRYTYATSCNPGGSCPLVGIENVLQAYTETFFNYGPGGELLSKVTDQYNNILSAAREFNWRQGSVNGAPKNFTPLQYADMYLHSRVVEEYKEKRGGNVQERTTYTSNAAEGSGLGILEADFEGAAVAVSTAIRTPFVNGTFDNLSTNTNRGGEGMILDVVAAGSGEVLSIELDDYVDNELNFNYRIQGSGVPVYGGSGTGMSLNYSILRLFDGGTPFTYELLEIASPGSGYLPNDVVWNQQPGLGIQNGEFSVRLSEVSAPRVSASVKQSGSGYFEGDEVWVTAATLVQAGAPGAAGQGNMVFEVQVTAGNDSEDALTPGLASLSVKTPMPSLVTGVYRGLQLESIDSSRGTGGTADVYVLDSGAAEQVSMTQSPRNVFGDVQFGNIGWPVTFAVRGGTGKGLTVSVRYNRSSNEGNLPQSEWMDGWNIVEIVDGGSGYLSGDTCSVSYEDLHEAFYWVEDDEDRAEDLLLEITDTGGRSAEAYPASAGRGYAKGDLLGISIDDLYSKGATTSTSQVDMKIRVATVVEGTNQSLISINALAGKVTKEISKSITITTLPIAPDSLNSPTTNTEEEKTLISIRNDKFLNSPPEASEYTEEASVPVPFLFESGEDVLEAVENYAIYLGYFTLGDALGLQIVENLTDEIAEGWYPGASFRYADPFSNQILAMRADACVWGLSPSEAGVSINGIFLGLSTGSLVIPDNLVGNILPVPGGENEAIDPAPPIVIVPPFVDDEDGINQGVFSMIIEVEIGCEISIRFEENSAGGGSPAPETVKVSVTAAMYLEGLLVTAGSTLETSSGGGLPYSYKGSLLTADSVTVTPDLFD